MSWSDLVCLLSYAILMTELRVVATVNIRFVSATTFVRSQAAVTEATIPFSLTEGGISCVE